MMHERGPDVELAVPGGHPASVPIRGAVALARKGRLGAAARLLLKRPRIRPGQPGAAADRELLYRELEDLADNFGDAERRG